MERGYKMRIYPNKEQSILINKTLGCSRFVFNQGLALRSDNYKNGLPANYGVTNAKLNELKADTDTAFLRKLSILTLNPNTTTIKAIVLSIKKIISVLMVIISNYLN